MTSRSITKVIRGIQIHKPNPNSSYQKPNKKMEKCWCRPILEENQGSLKKSRQRWKNGERTNKKEKPTPRKSSYKVYKLLQSSWKVDKR
jgi:hypothetical protein